MNSSAPLERLINAVMALDGFAADGNHAMELRYLLRKIEWVAAEAETTRQRCVSRPPATPVLRVGLQDAA